MFLNPNIFSSLNLKFSNSLDMRNLHEQVEKAFCYQKFFWPLTAVWLNCSIDLKIFANSWPSSASNFKSYFDHYVEQSLFTIGQNNFGNKIPLFPSTDFHTNDTSFSQTSNNILNSHIHSLFKPCYITLGKYKNLCKPNIECIRMSGIFQQCYKQKFVKWQNLQVSIRANEIF